MRSVIKLTVCVWRKVIAVCVFLPDRQLSILLNPLNSELNPICHLLTLLESRHILHVSRIRVNGEESNAVVC